MKKIYLLLSFCLIHFMTQAQTIPSYVPTNGLVGWWPFNGNANDESGNGNNGAVNGASLTIDRNGNLNSAYSFDGVSNSINIQDNLTFDITFLSPFTISFWYKAPNANAGNFDGLISRGWLANDSFFGFQIGLTPYGLRFQTNGPSCFGDISEVTPNAWSHIVQIYSMNTGYINTYINGILYSSLTSCSQNISQLDNNFDLKFGVEREGNLHFNGILDDIAIYNRALTQQEIADLYQATPPCSLSISSQPTNQSTTTGSNTSFNVGVTTDCNTLTNYQWQTNTGFGWQTLQDAGQYTGVNSATLNVSNVGSANTNQLFRCLISSGLLVDTTQAATLTVVNTSNTNLSGVTHAIPYQAVVRDGGGNPLINHPLTVRCTLHNNTASGTSIYQETHTISTNNLGLFTLHIGTGVASIGNIDSIHWALYKKYLEVEFDTTAQGNTYIDLGTQQLMSVPYALYAETAGNALNAPKGDKGDAGVNGSNGTNGVAGATGPAGPQGAQGVVGSFPNGTAAGEMLYWNGTAWMSVLPGAEGQSLSFHNGTPTWESRLSVGMEYQGGIIAYILHQGDIGYDPSTVHGLIAAPFDQSSGAPCGCYGTTFPGADGTAIGTGNQNTIDIMNGCGNVGIAARICGDLVLNGYSDWYLPSKDELTILYSNKALIGGFDFALYWSSSKFGNNNSWGQSFSNGNQSPYDKSTYYSVRAIRSF